MSSKRGQRRRQCAGKVRYGSAAEAGRRCFDGMTAYRCPHCSGFHVGHPPKKVRQAIAARRRLRRTKGWW